MNPLLAHTLHRLAAHYAAGDIEEIAMNRPGEVWVKAAGDGWQPRPDAGLTEDYVLVLCQQLANVSGQLFHPSRMPLLYATLAEGHRFTAVVGPNVRYDMGDTRGVAVNVRVFDPRRKITLDRYGLKERTALAEAPSAPGWRRYDASPLDVVGWDGAVYPVAFPILAFQPRVGLVHLPPTWHGTFAARSALVCSFVPRPLDFAPDAVPCPYPHASVDVDEVIFYVRGAFTSRRGVGPGSISHHPAGLMHGPQPGAYEASIGKRETDELAVMLDVYAPLRPTAAALAIEDPGYEASFTA